MRTRFVLLPAAALIAAFLIAASVPVTHAGDMTATTSCTGSQQITFSWYWNENPAYPTGHPEWVGYDVLRRPVNTCGAFERINAGSFPRIFGQSHSHEYVDTPPATLETYEYRAIPVDADRNLVHMLSTECDPPCVKSAWASCAVPAAPLTIGTLIDWGWALAVQPCVGSCYYGFYFTGPIEQELRNQGRIGTVVKMYGPAWCCSVEGPYMDPTAWEPGDCGVLPTARTSWGGLKTIYR